MELNRDTLFSVALELDLASLLNFCNSSKKIDDLICKRKDIWIRRLMKDYPVLNEATISKLRNPRETYMKIIDAKTDSQMKFNRYLWDRDYEMRDILPKIYHIIWPHVGVVHGNKFMVESPSYFAYLSKKQFTIS